MSETSRRKRARCGKKERQRLSAMFEGTVLDTEALRPFQSTAHPIFRKNAAVVATVTKLPTGGSSGLGAAPPAGASTEERTWPGTESFLRATEHPECSSCPICLDDEEESFKLKAVRLTRCGHVFCESCIIEWARCGSRMCPVCKGKFAILQEPSEYPREFFFGPGRILTRNSLWDASDSNPSDESSPGQRFNRESLAATAGPAEPVRTPVNLTSSQQPELRAMGQLQRRVASLGEDESGSETPAKVAMASQEASGQSGDTCIAVGSHESQGRIERPREPSTDAFGKAPSRDEEAVTRLAIAKARPSREEIRAKVLEAAERRLQERKRGPQSMATTDAKK
eukprot:INCI17846.1.p1 GENE.INCI17846.1~~INCI17846.1.p1  ORF type:complete len:340 (-),score=42.06 INCI17846.1:142-1161(-)